MKVVAETNENANIIRSSIEPDNLAEPPITFTSRCDDKTLVIIIRNIGRLETALSTLVDLISAIQTVDRILEVKKENNI